MATCAAWQAPPGARPNRGARGSQEPQVRLRTGVRVGCLRRPVTAVPDEWPSRALSRAILNPAYRPAGNCHCGKREARRSTPGAFPWIASLHSRNDGSSLAAEPARGMREHRIDLARLRGEIGAGQGVVAIVAAHVGQQPLELLHIAIDRIAEFEIVAVAPADLVEGLRAAPDIKRAREGVHVAAPIIVPSLGNRRMIDHPGNIVRDRPEWLVLF